MPSVCVWPTYNVPGWNGTLDAAVEEFPVVELREALERRYDVDAYFTVVLVNDSAQPRLTKGALDRMREMGLDPRAWVIAIDVDAPGSSKEEKYANATDEWWEANATLLSASPTWTKAGWYRTRGGYRLVWTLPEALTPEAYEEVHARLRNELTRVGVKVDHLPDWTRIYRLPLVRRDGVDEDRPRDWSNLGDLDVSLLQDIPAARKFALAPIRRSAWDTDLSENRNVGLLSIAGKIVHAMPDIPDDYLVTFLQAVNQEKCPIPLDDKEVERIAQNALRYRPDPDAVPDGDASPDDAVAPTRDPAVRDEVQISKSEMVRAMTETLAVLGKYKGRVFNQGGRLIRLLRNSNNELEMVEMERAALRTAIERVVKFVKWNDKAGELVPEDIPRDLVDMIAAKGDYGQDIWPLHEILTCPTLDSEGEPIARYGYHEETAVFLDADKALLDMDLTGDPGQALDTLRDLISEFPFERPEHESVALAAILTPIVRSAIRGPVPLVMFDSTTPGSGKTYLADAAAILATGRQAPRERWVEEAEFEKRVSATLGSGKRLVLIDNVDKPIGGATLDALLTSDTWTVRIFGNNKQVYTLRARAMWMATGNNMTIQGDLARRALRCYITPSQERPEERANFKYDPFLEHVAKNRRAYVQAALTLVSAYIKAGRPRMGLKPIGGFEDWSRTVRGALVWAGMPDPVLTQGDLRSDNVSATWGLLLQACRTVYGDKWFSARDVFELGFRMVGNGIANKAAHETITNTLEELMGIGPPAVRGVSFLFKRWLNRVVDGRKLVRGEFKDRNKGQVFRVMDMTVEAQSERGEESSVADESAAESTA